MTHYLPRMNLSATLAVLSFVVLLVSFWNRNDLPGNVARHPQLESEPRQTPTEADAFDVSYNGIDYRVSPQFDYELYGMVVSFRHHDGNSRMHRRAGDHLNMLDVCVIWGDNVLNPRLDKIDFWNGIFTCNVKTRDREAWRAFDMRGLSNNHLISDRKSIRDAVSGIRVGDQIRVRGQLASYRGPVGERGTSVTREDTGDGACETIYVEEFAVVAKALSVWRMSMYGALIALLAALVAYWRRPYRPFATR